MKIPVKAYKEEDGLLHFQESGECQIYAPEMKDNTEPYVSLNFGKWHLHVSMKDFKAISSKILYNKSEDNDDALILR